MRVGIVAGEASGDCLAAGLVRALRRRVPHLQVEGVGGEELREAGCRVLFPLDKLAVMGLVEVAGSLPALIRLRRRLLNHFLESPPDLFIGVDSPDFNLGLEQNLRRHGIGTVHYVGPSVWAWRRYRLRRIRRAVSLMLVLFPFEARFYRDHGVPVSYTGHPLADRIRPEPDRAAARERLGLNADRPLIAVMPGSRRAELDRMLAPMLKAAKWCSDERDDLGFISSLLNDDAVAAVSAKQARLGLQALPITVYKDRAQDVIEAADVVLLASGTVALEAMLLKKPMVVTYRVNPLTYYILRLLVRIEHVSLPNILAGEEVVPELLQGQCRPDKLGAAVLEWLNNPDRVAALQARFHAMHGDLARNAEESAAEAIVSHFNLA